jgi:Flp pilus assembly pilin Flp
LNVLLTRIYVLGQSRESGQTMAEYVIVLGLITAGILLAMGVLSGSVSGAIGKAASDV